MEVGTPSAREMSKSLDDETIQLGEDDETKLVHSQKALVGKIITWRILNKGAIKQMLLKAWELYDGVQVSDVGFNMFLFTFNREEEV